jgi:multicomponent Na+:H+ antiporter subunit C
MLQRHLVKFVFGLVLMNHAVNLLLFAAGRLTRGRPALIPDNLRAPAEVVANALPQALILTAIVIGFGLLVFALALAYRSYYVLRSTEMDEMRVAEPVEER